MNTQEQLQHACGLLAMRCNGAITEDGQGFSKFDSDRGRKLAVLPISEWTDDTTASAYLMLRKYRVQLKNYGFDYSSIIAPEIKPTRYVDASVGASVKFIHEYNKPLFDIIHQISGARYSGLTKIHAIPVGAMNIQQIMDVVREYGFTVLDSAAKIFQEHGDAVADVQPQVVRTGTMLNNRLALSNQPYDKTIHLELKEISNRMWNEKLKAWTFDIVFNNLQDLINIIGKYGFVLDDAARTAIDNAVKHYAKFKQEPGSIKTELYGDPLWQFQEKGVWFLHNNDRAVLADDMGLGKTKQAIATVVHGWNQVEIKDRKRVIVVCPKSVMEMWRRAWLEELVIATMWNTKNTATVSLVTIINYDIVAKPSGDTTMLQKLLELNADTVIFDEFHRLRNASTDRFGACRTLAYHTPRVYGLTGTPVHNAPADMYNLLVVLNRHHEFGDSLVGFSRRYEWRLSQLNEDMLSAGVYLRRLKKEHWAELKTIWANLDWELSNRAEYDRASDNFINWVAEQYGEAKANKALRAFALVYINTMRQLAARGKIESAIAWAKEMMADGESVVIFAEHVDVMHEIARQCGGVVIDGQTKNRQEIVDAFAARKIQLLVCSLKAGGEGIDGLQKAASICLFLSCGWTAAALLQAKDRLERPGQENTVQAYMAIVPNTMDEHMARIVKDKAAMSSEITDGVNATDADDSVVGALLDWAWGQAIRRNQVRV